jgi:hypothetical protein
VPCAHDRKIKNKDNHPGWEDEQQKFSVQCKEHRSAGADPVKDMVVHMYA